MGESFGGRAVLIGQLKATSECPGHANGPGRGSLSDGEQGSGLKILGIGSGRWTNLGKTREFLGNSW